MKPDVPKPQVLVTLPELGLPVGPKRQKGVAAANRVLPAMRKGGSPLGQVAAEFNGGHPSGASRNLQTMRGPWVSSRPHERAANARDRNDTSSAACPGGLRYCTLAIEPGMEDLFLVMCPYCGQQVEIYLEPDVRGSFVQDCEICCNPWRVRVSGRGGDRHVDVVRADGSE